MTRVAQGRGSAASPDTLGQMSSDATALVLLWRGRLLHIKAVDAMFARYAAIEPLKRKVLGFLGPFRDGLKLASVHNFEGSDGARYQVVDAASGEVEYVTNHVGLVRAVGWSASAMLLL